MRECITARSKFPGAGKRAAVRAWCEKDLPAQFAGEEQMHVLDRQQGAARTTCIAGAEELIAKGRSCGMNMSGVTARACGSKADSDDAFHAVSRPNCEQILWLL